MSLRRDRRRKRKRRRQHESQPKRHGAAAADVHTNDDGWPRAAWMPAAPCQLEGADAAAPWAPNAEARGVDEATPTILSPSGRLQGASEVKRLAYSRRQAA